MADDVKALVERLNNFCIDWDGSIMEREESPMDGLRCGDVLDATAALTAQAEEIERLRARLEITDEITERYDGIACRDETIRLLEQKIAALKAAQEVKA